MARGADVDEGAQPAGADVSVSMAVVACANHPAREAIGICVKCKKRVCGECTTKVEGINHCVSCFGGLVAESAAEKPVVRREHPAVAFVLALFGAAVASGLAWGVLELGLPGGG
jgi:hypothetical protein